MENPPFSLRQGGFLANYIVRLPRCQEGAETGDFCARRGKNFFGGPKANPSGPFCAIGTTARHTVCHVFLSVSQVYGFFSAFRLRMGKDIEILSEKMKINGHFQRKKFLLQ